MISDHSSRLLNTTPVSSSVYYRKCPNVRTSSKLVVITLKSKLIGFTREMPSKDADGYADSEDPDQTARGAV